MFFIIGKKKHLLTLGFNEIFNVGCREEFPFVLANEAQLMLVLLKYELKPYVLSENLPEAIQRTSNNMLGISDDGLYCFYCYEESYKLLLKKVEDKEDIIRI